MAFDEFVKFVQLQLVERSHLETFMATVVSQGMNLLRMAWGHPPQVYIQEIQDTLRHVVIWSFVCDQYHIFVICKTEVNRNEGGKEERNGEETRQQYLEYIRRNEEKT